MNNIFICASFFSCLFLSFHHTLFMGLREPWKFFLEFSLKVYANHLPGVQVMEKINLQCNNLSQTHLSVFFRLKTV